MAAVDPATIREWIKAHIEKSQQKKEEPKKRSFTRWLLGDKKGTTAPILSNDAMSEQEAEAIEKELSAVPEFKPGQLSLNLIISIGEAVIDVGSESKRNPHLIEGIRAFLSQISLNFTQMPAIDLTFDAVASIKDFGVRMFLYDTISQNLVLQ